MEVDLLIFDRPHTQTVRAHLTKNRSPVPVRLYWHEAFYVDWQGRRFCLGFSAKNARGSHKELFFPLLDLVGVDIELLG